MRIFFFYIYLLFQFNFFGIGYNEEQSYNLVRALGGLTIFAFFSLGNKSLRSRYNLLVFSLLSYIIIEIVLSSIIYETSPFVMFAFTLGFATCLSYFTFNNLNKEHLIRMLCLFASITVTTLTLLYILFIFKGIEPLIKFSQIPMRMGVQRIFIGAYLMPYCFILALSKIISFANAKQRIPALYIITLILTLFDMFFFLMVRAYLVIVLFTAIILILICLRGKPRLYFFLAAFIIMLIGIEKIGIIGDYIEFSKDVDNDSMSIRYSAIDFYFKQTINNNFITGLGFIKGGNYRLDQLLSGPQGEYYREDVGIWGYFNTFGLIGVIWLLLLIYKTSIIVINKFKNKTIYKHPEFLGILLIFTFSEFTTINIIYYGGISALPIILLLLHENKQNSFTKKAILSKIQKNISINNKSRSHIR